MTSLECGCGLWPVACGCGLWLWVSGASLVSRIARAADGNGYVDFGQDDWDDEAYSGDEGEQAAFSRILHRVSANLSTTPEMQEPAHG